MTALLSLATASVDIGATSSRLAKAARLVEVLQSADITDVATVVAWLSGELPQRQIGVGWASLKSLPAPADAPSLTVSGVDDAFSTIKSTNTS